MVDTEGAVRATAKGEVSIRVIMVEARRAVEATVGDVVYTGVLVVDARGAMLVASTKEADTRT